MRLVLCLLLVCIMTNCKSRSPIENGFIVRVKSVSEPQLIDISNGKDLIQFDDSFWTEFVSRFPDASVCLFSQAWRDTTIGNIKLSDSAYTYVHLSPANKNWLLQHLPPNLSKEKSDSYWQMQIDGFFIESDSTSSTKRNRPWKKASETFTRDYDRFYRVLKSHEENHIFIVHRDFKRKMAELL
jgi:hypothetical protein